MSLLFALFWGFARIGLFTFGGGYAMIALIEHRCVEEKKWITGDEMMNITVIAESTPGPIAINCATYVGYKQKGFAGALLATLGMILPSFVILFVISLYLDRFLEITWISHAFLGIKVAVGILILDAGLKMAKKMKGKTFPRAVAVCSFVATIGINALALPISSMVLMITAGLLSLTLFVAGKQNGKKEKAGKVEEKQEEKEMEKEIREEKRKEVRKAAEEKKKEVQKAAGCREEKGGKP